MKKFILSIFAMLLVTIAFSQTKVYNEGNYFFLETEDGKVYKAHTKDVLVTYTVEGSNDFYFHNIDDWSPRGRLTIGNIVDKSGTPYTLQEFKDFYTVNTGGFSSTSGGSGVVETIVAGTNVTVDSTDPANPIVTASVDTSTYLTSEDVNEKINNRIKVDEASDLAGILSSTAVYLIDGKIDMGSTEITVPDGGLFLDGLDYFVSALYSSTANHIMFKSPLPTEAGNLKISNISIYSSGAGSQIFDLDNENNFGAIELNGVNLGDFSVETTSLGELDSFRQLRFNDCAFIRIGDGITFSGTWEGGFKIGDTILLSIPASTTVFKEGTSLVFSGSSFSDLNALSIDATTTVFDFDEANFTLDEGFQLNGARFNTASDPVPNLPVSSTKRFFKDCTGVKNTFGGGIWSVSIEALTTITTVDTPVKLAGTTTYTDLVYLTQSTDNAFIYASSIEKDFKVTGGITIDGGPSDDVTIYVRQWDDSASAYIDLQTIKRRINGVAGPDDIADFPIQANANLNINDRIEIWGENNTDTTDITLVLTSFLALDVRL